MQVSTNLSPAARHPGIIKLRLARGDHARTRLQKESFQSALKAGVKIVFGALACTGPGTRAKDSELMVRIGNDSRSNYTVLGSRRTIGLAIPDGEKQVCGIVAGAGNTLDDITELERVKFAMKTGEIVRSGLR